MFTEKPTFTDPAASSVFDGTRKAIEYSLMEIIGAIAYAKGFTLVSNEELKRLTSQDQKLRLEKTFLFGETENQEAC